MVAILQLHSYHQSVVLGIPIRDCPPPKLLVVRLNLIFDINDRVQGSCPICGFLASNWFGRNAEVFFTFLVPTFNH